MRVTYLGPLVAGLVMTAAIWAGAPARADVAAVCAPYAREWNAATAGGNAGTIARVRAKLSGAKGACPDLWRRVQAWKAPVVAAPKAGPIAKPSLVARASGLTIRPLGQPLRHTSWLSRAVFSPDGRSIVTTSGDHVALLWDAQTRQPLSFEVLPGYQGYDAKFSPDGRQIVIGVGLSAQVWDIASGRRLATLSHQYQVNSAGFSPNGLLVVTASNDKNARIWDVTTGQVLTTLTGHSGEVRCAAFSPDGRRIVTTSNDGTARIWDSANGQPLATLTGHAQTYMGTAVFSPDGRRIVTTSWDKTARIWDAESGLSLTTLTGHKGAVTSARYSPDGRWIVTSSFDHTARVWDAESGRLLATVTGHTQEVISADFSPDGRQIITASYDRTARIWAIGSTP